MVHAGRVYLLVSMLAEKMDLAIESTAYLMIAAVVHDLGRTNNCDDSGHGERSAKIFKMLMNSRHIIESIVTLHSRSDKSLDSQYELISILTQIFKDADALDRVRTGDLNPKFLRLDEARDMIGIAREIYDATR